MAAKLHDVMVTDHAVLRYLERVVGIDVERARAAIRTSVGGPAALGATKVAKDGVVYALDGAGTVITIVPGEHGTTLRAHRRNA